MENQEMNDQYILEWQRFIHLLMDEFGKMQNHENWSDSEVKAMFRYLMNENQGNINLLYIKKQFDFPNIIVFSIIIAFVYEFDTKLKGFINDYFHKDIPEFYDVFALYQIIDEIHFSDVIRLIPIGIMNCIFRFSTKEESLLYQKISLHHHVLKFLSDQVLLVRKGMVLDIANSDFLSIHEDSYVLLKSSLEFGNHVAIVGENGVGKMALAQRYAKEESKSLLVLDIGYVESLPFYEQENYLNQILFFVFMENTLLVFQNIESSSPCLYRFCFDFHCYQIPWVLCTKTRLDIISEVTYIEVPNHLSKEDMQVVIKQWELDKSLLEYHYSIQNLKDIKKGQFIKAKMKNKNSYVQIVQGMQNFKDFLCDDKTKEIIHSMLYQISHRNHIQGYFKTVKQTQGMQVVFHGPSGTGKTMLASIMANVLEVPLYRVNLAMINDKYIGESEKHLEEVFAMAEQENCILLFDEADVLFSKRVEVKSSNDRHANSATAFLLQRLESYQGIVVLTSNLIHNFDDAFLRRMKFIIRLGKPNKLMQKEKWKQLLYQISLPNEIDIDEVNAWNDITLATIENIVNFALAKTLEENDKVIGMKHIAKAYQFEMQKEGNLMNFSKCNRVYMDEKKLKY